MCPIFTCCVALSLRSLVSSSVAIKMNASTRKRNTSSAVRTTVPHVLNRLFAGSRTIRPCQWRPELANRALGYETCDMYTVGSNRSEDFLEVLVVSLCDFSSCMQRSLLWGARPSGLSGTPWHTPYKLRIYCTLCRTRHVLVYGNFSLKSTVHAQHSLLYFTEPRHAMSGTICLSEQQIMSFI